MLIEKDLLLGILSHEIKSPLTTIFGNAHLLLSSLKALDDPTRMQAISDIRTEAERLNRLVENMLLLARAGAQAVVPTESLLVRDAIDLVVNGQMARFPERSLRVKVTPKSLIVKAQADYFGQVLQNLLGNAEKYSPVTQPIDIRAHRKGDEVVISVLDRGRGIDAKEAEIIFQAFYRSARTATAVGGAGIGLAVCKLLVQAQSGRIFVRARRGGGSIFTFGLPAVVVSAPGESSHV